MAIARKHQIDITVTHYYHCISRCVRQAFLCGKSKYTKKNYSHRRAWVISRLKELSEIFSINICAYAIMSNHYHLVLYVDLEKAKSWSADEIVSRWKSLFKNVPDIEMLHEEVASKLIEQYREQLTDISWFMRCLNEYLARKANLEEGCKGRFWEGRFKSQALLDEAALLTCMSYVDLNPIRAGICESLEQSDFTSIQQRLRDYTDKNDEVNVMPRLMPFKNKTDNDELFIPFNEQSYFELVHWSGRVVREDKKGFIPISVKNTLNLYQLNENNWSTSIKYFGKNYSWLVGRVEKIRERCVFLKKKWIQGVGAGNACFFNRVA